MKGGSLLVSWRCGGRTGPFWHQAFWRLSYDSGPSRSGVIVNPLWVIHPYLGLIPQRLRKNHSFFSAIQVIVISVQFMSTETAAMMGKAPCSRIFQVGEMSIWRQNHTESRVKRHMLLPAGCFLFIFFPCLGIISWNCIVTYWVLSWLVSSRWICRGTTTRMLCFSSRLRPTRSESIVPRHFLGILRLESEFKGNIWGIIPSHSITWLQNVAKGCSLGMQPTFFGSLWWSQVVHPKGTYVITSCMPRVCGNEHIGGLAKFHSKSNPTST